MADEKKEKPKPDSVKRWKTVGRRGFFLGIALLVLAGIISLFIEDDGVKTKKFGGVGVPTTPYVSTVDPTEKFVKVDLSQRREDIIPEEVMVPDKVTGKKAHISLPCYRVKGGIMWYQVTASPTFKVEYDFLDGKPVHRDGPGELLVVERFPPVFHAQAMGKGGKMTLTLTRQFLPDNVGQGKKVSSKKKVRQAHKDRSGGDKPHSVQIM